MLERVDEVRIRIILRTTDKERSVTGLRVRAAAERDV